MSQNKKKFFGKRKNEQELEQTQTLTRPFRRRKILHRKKHPKKLMLTKKTRRQSSLLNPFAKDLIKVNASALSLQPD